MYQSSEVVRVHGDEFYATFKLFLRKFVHPMFGFDVIKFDAWLEVPDGVSTIDHIKERFGQAGVDVVNRLLV